MSSVTAYEPSNPRSVFQQDDYLILGFPLGGGTPSVIEGHRGEALALKWTQVLNDHAREFNHSVKYRVFARDAVSLIARGGS